MENNKLEYNDKLHIDEFFKSDGGKKFISALKDTYEAHLNLAQTMYTKIINPNEQISVQVNQATGVKEVIDFIEAISIEVKEKKKEEEEQSEA